MDSLSSNTSSNKTTQETTFIYGLVDPNTHSIRYIGKANDPHVRLYRHLKEKSHTHKSMWLRSLKERGLSPEMQIIEEVPVLGWQASERYWIKYYREQGCDLTNSTDGGDGLHGYVITEEHREKLSKAAIGKKRGPMSEEQKTLFSSIRKGKPKPALSVLYKGKPFPDKAYETLKERRTGKPLSEEVKQKISDTKRSRGMPEEERAKLRERKLTEEHKAKLAASRHATPDSEETRLKMSLAHKGQRHPHSEQARENMRLTRLTANARKRGMTLEEYMLVRKECNKKYVSREP